jgi:hypothetical protein
MSEVRDENKTGAAMKLAATTRTQTTIMRRG